MPEEEEEEDVQTPFKIRSVKMNMME